ASAKEVGQDGRRDGTLLAGARAKRASEGYARGLRPERVRRGGVSRARISRVGPGGPRALERDGGLAVMTSGQTATFRIWRGDARGGAFADYPTTISEGMVVLDAVHQIQAEQANDLAVRWN